MTRGPIPGDAMSASLVLAQATNAVAGAAGNTGPLASLMSSGLPIMVAFFALFYFLMIRPQQKRAKEQKLMIDALTRGDEVVTAGGVLGRVSKLGETYLHVEVANGVELQVQRSSIVQVLPKGTLK